MESVKEKGLLLKVTASFVSGDDGIRTHVPVARQLDFESSSLWPLRYVSIFGKATEKTFRCRTYLL